MKKENVVYYISKVMRIESKDVKSFCSLTGDCQNLHLNPKKAKNSVYGKIIVPGILLEGKLPEMHFDILRNKEKINGDIEIILKKITAKFFIPVFLGENIRYYWYLKSSKKHRLGTQRDMEILIKSKQKLKAKFNASFIYPIEKL